MAEKKIKVAVSDLQAIASWAKMGEGDILMSNNPRPAAAQLNRIYQKVQQLLSEEK